MQKYRAKQVVSLDVGTVVALDAKQAGDRKGRVEPLGEDRYRLKESLQFKAGERFGFEGELSHVQADALELLEAPPVAEVAPAGRRRRAERADELHL